MRNNLGRIFVKFPVNFPGLVGNLPSLFLATTVRSMGFRATRTSPQRLVPLERVFDGADAIEDQARGASAPTAIDRVARLRRTFLVSDSSQSRQPPSGAGAAERGSISRACSAIAISAEPPNTILMPTSSPIAQAAVPGRPAKMIVAKIRSMMPLASIQPHRRDSSRLCSSANIIEATPSITKNTMRTKVSERTPLNGHNSSTIPAATPRIAETSDHQKPGAPGSDSDSVNLGSNPADMTVYFPPCSNLARGSLGAHRFRAEDCADDRGAAMVASQANSAPPSPPSSSEVYALRSRRAAARRKRPRLESDACERWRPSRHSADEMDRRPVSLESGTRLYGAVSSGTGKTHACLALGLAACQRGFSVAFFTAAGLVHQLMEAGDERRLLKLQTQLAAVKPLIVDELGYVPLSQTGAELLFEIFSQRHERVSTIVTSNLPFEEWTRVFGNQRLTGALLDRLTHHVHILELNGESYRLKQSKTRRRRDPRPPDEVDAAADPETGEIIRAS